uniref:AAA+ ATPase domain-containing protein n=1 Tax=Glossina pallidipes TaxID=7398 RepID=A0A1A9ZEK9_GLOPL
MTYSCRIIPQLSEYSFFSYKHTMAYIFFYSTVLSLISLSLAFFDPVTIGWGAAAIVGAWNADFLKDQTYCRYKECCNERGIPANVNALRIKLEDLYGQHIVKQQLIPALASHLKNGGHSRKPLVISFHGTPGTGKNMVADMIANSIYAEGLQSKFVHKFMGRAEFPSEEHSSSYSYILHNRVTKAIAICPRSLFIFDEVDKMPKGVFEALTSIVDYKSFANGVDFSKAIFIFLSNTAGVEISTHLGNLLLKGILREHTKLGDFEAILERAAYNLDGGLSKSSLIEAHVIDHFIPFLPLEKSHIYQCLYAEFGRYNMKPDKETLDEIVGNSVTYDPIHGVFAKSGCKKLDKKVAVVAYRRRY